MSTLIGLNNYNDEDSSYLNQDAPGIYGNSNFTINPGYVSEGFIGNSYTYDDKDIYFLEVREDYQYTIIMYSPETGLEFDLRENSYSYLNTYSSQQSGYLDTLTYVSRENETMEVVIHSSVFNASTGDYEITVQENYVGPPNNPALFYINGFTYFGDSDGRLEVGEQLFFDVVSVSDQDGYSTLVTEYWRLSDGTIPTIISGANDNYITITNNMIGKELSYIASFTDGLGNIEGYVKPYQFTIVKNDLDNIELNDPLSFNEHMGTSSSESIVGASNFVFFGLDGDDNYNSSERAFNQVFIGGEGSDNYNINLPGFMTIADYGLNGTDTVTASGIGITSASTFAAEVDNRHLFVYDINSLQSIIVIDYKDAENQIETVNLVDGTYSYSDIADNLTTFPNYQGNMSWAQIAALGGTTHSGNDIDNQLDFYKIWYEDQYNYTPSGNVSITGTAQQGQTLSADASNIHDEDGFDPNTFTYQWLADGIAINGAAFQTFTLTQDEVDKVISVAVNYTDGGGVLETVTSDETAEVGNINDSPSGSVSIDGTAEENQVLSVVNNFSDEDGIGSLNYQWYADGNAITGATAQDYTLTHNEVSKKITVKVSYEDLGGVTEVLESDPTTDVININDPPLGSVMISGTAEENQVLSAINNFNDEDGIGSLNYQWYADENAILGATGQYHTLTQSEVGKKIAVKVTYEDLEGTNEALWSDPTVDVSNFDDPLIGTVTITGFPQEDGNLIADINDLTDDDGIGSFSYQWFADGQLIDGAINQSYSPVQDLIGQKISVEVVHTDTFGNQETRSSVQTNPIIPRNDNPTGNVVITSNEDFAHKSDQFTVNNLHSNFEGDPSITQLSDGGFVITWTSGHYSKGDGWDGDQSGVVGQRYDGQGFPIGSQFLVNETREGRQVASSVDGLDDGGFVITWISSDEIAPPVVMARIYDTNGNAGNEFTLDSGNVHMTQPRIENMGNEKFLLYWRNTDEGGDRGQVFDYDGSTLGSELRFEELGFDALYSNNIYQTSFQLKSLGNDEFISVWKGNGGIFWSGFRS